MPILFQMSKKRQLFQQRLQCWINRIFGLSMTPLKKRHSGGLLSLKPLFAQVVESPLEFRMFGQSKSLARNVCKKLCSALER
jgi:hypothetical protein